MRQSTRILINATVNMSAGFINMAIRLILTPLVIYYIGKEHYGVYVIVGGLALYTPYLHMGMGSAVTRYTAAHLGRKEYDELNAVVNTGVLYYRFVGLAFLLVSLFLAFFVVHLFIDNQALHPTARLCAVLFGVIEAAGMQYMIFSSVIWGIDRIDLWGMTNTGFRVVRLLALWALLPFLNQEHGLIAVTTIMVATNLLPALVLRRFALRLTPNLVVDRHLARIKLVPRLLSFGINTVAWDWSQMMLDYTAFLLIGYFLTTKDVTDYQVPSSVLMLVAMMVQQMMSAMIPAASRLSATQQEDQLRELFLRSAKYAGGMAFAGCSAMAILAPTLLYVWVGDRFLDVAVILSILAFGRAFYYLQMSSRSVLIGLARHRVPAIISVVSLILVASSEGLVLTLTKWGVISWGLVGVACVAAVGFCLGWGVAMPVYVTRVLKVRLRAYYLQSVVRPVIAVLPAAAAWLALRHVPLEYGILTIIAAVLAGFILVPLGWWFVLFDEWDRNLAREKVRALIAKVKARRAGATDNDTDLQAQDESAASSPSTDDKGEGSSRD